MIYLEYTNSYKIPNMLWLSQVFVGARKSIDGAPGEIATFEVWKLLPKNNKILKMALL
jgi:hypothetical protein